MEKGSQKNKSKKKNSYTSGPSSGQMGSGMDKTVRLGNDLFRVSLCSFLLLINQISQWIVKSCVTRHISFRSAQCIFR